jgi:tRNA-binding protein
MSVSYEDFQRLQLRVGQVVKASKIPGKDRILAVEIDVGGRTVQAIAGGAEYYKPEDFMGKRVVVVINLESRTIAGMKSEAMLLAADVNGKPIWLTVDGEVPAGSPVR